MEPLTAADREALEDKAALDTYRTLRSGLVTIGVLLALGLVVHIVRSGGRVPPSISATFYTDDLRGIFVATLLAVGLALVTVKGRPGAENSLLDIAGILIPVVGFVPTPIADPSCPVPGRDCVPAAFDTAIDTNMLAYLGAGLLALLVAGWRMWSVRSSTPWSPSTRTGVLALAALWVVYAGAYALVRPVFVQYAHYTSAISFFVLLIIVVWINGRNSTGVGDLADLSGAAYRRIYRSIAIAMLVAVAVGVVVFAVTGRQNAVVDDRFAVVFWIEAVLLALFVTYWVFQTVELWSFTIPPRVVPPEPRPATSSDGTPGRATPPLPEASN
ncbi:MAG: hypothetical protein J0I14_02385 [Propionibacteriaceae bacterium]|nr:hypothetical protein [Propionibacteriaceae bacterium]